MKWFVATLVRLALFYLMMPAIIPAFTWTLLRLGWENGHVWGLRLYIRMLEDRRPGQQIGFGRRNGD